MTQTISFYFDPISPYVYFAFHLIAHKKLSHPIRPVPVLFVGLLNAHGQKGPAEIVAKRAYTMLDGMRIAKYLGLPYQSPPAHPFNPLLALRSACAIEDDTQRFKFGFELTKVCWGEGLDLTKPETIELAAQRVGSNGKEILEKTQTDGVKQTLKKNTDDAISKGVFGVPTFGVDDQIFWGHDRIDLLEQYLTGKLNIDANFLNEVLNRPRAADRK